MVVSGPMKQEEAACGLSVLINHLFSCYNIFTGKGAGASELTQLQLCGLGLIFKSRCTGQQWFWLWFERKKTRRDVQLDHLSLAFFSRSFGPNAGPFFS